MRDRAHPPRNRDTTILEGGAKLGWFWSDCKRDKRCTRPPYDELLTNPVLRADYHNSRSGIRGPRTNGSWEVSLTDPRRMWTTYGPSSPL